MNPLRKKLSELSEEMKAQLYKDVFNTVSGALVLEDLRERCFVYITTQNEKNEGMRCVVLHIETQLNFEYPTEQIEGD